MVKDNASYEVKYESGKTQTMLGRFLKAIFRDGYGNDIVSYSEVK